MYPLTASVLELIGADGIIVGSVARGKKFPKDVDVVVPGRGVQKRNPVFERLIRAYPEHIDSEMPGHLVITAGPYDVELFEYKFWDLKDPVKNAGRVSYRTARKRSRQDVLFGVQVRILNCAQEVAHELRCA